MPTQTHKNLQTSPNTLLPNPTETPTTKTTEITTQSESTDKPKTPSIHVRVTAAEYEWLKNDSLVTGESIPTLLKRIYFKGTPLTPLMPKEDARIVCTELGRIGNNLNQIAKKVNTGFLEGFHDEILKVERQFTGLFSFLTDKYGSRRKQGSG